MFSVTIDIFSGKQLVPEGLICQVIIASILELLLDIELAQGTFPESCKYNQNLSSPPSGICYLSQSCYPIFLLQTIFKLFGFQICLPLAYLMKVIPETCSWD